MRDAIAHEVHFFPGNVSEGGSECRVITLDVTRRFTNGFQITKDGVLDQVVSQKC